MDCDLATPAAEAARPPIAALAAICIAYFMVILDTTVVNVALPKLARGLHASTTGLQWIVDAYSLVFGAVLLSAGALGDRRGAKGVFQGGVALFALASLACGVAPSAAVLIAARCVQGLGAALAVPASLALLQDAFADRAARRRAIGVWGGVAGVAAGAGPVVGGALVAGLGWRSVFFVNLPIAAAGLLLSIDHVPKPAPRGHGADPAGQLVAIVGLTALTVALIEAGPKGWLSPLVLAALGVTIVAGAAFVAIEHRSHAPMLPLALFSSPGFSAATAVGLLLNLGFYGELFVMTLYLQQARHLSALLAGLVLLPQMGMAVVGSTASGRVMGRTGPRTPMLAGLLTGAAGFAGLAMVSTDRVAFGVLIAPLLAIGFGMSFTMPAATAAVMEAAPSERAGLASGTINAARQIGGALGVALLGTLIASHPGSMAGLDAGRFVAGGAFALGVALILHGIPADTVDISTRSGA